MPQKISRIAMALAITLAAVFLIRSAWDSLSWRYIHDSPLMVYAGYLISKGYVPYRDFFDMNVPGTYYVMWLMGSVFGWGDSGFRIFDLLCLLGISGMTFLWMRRFGLWAALAAAVAFPLWYLGYGSGMSLQREYIAIVPLAGLLLVATREGSLNPLLKFALAGLLTGLAMLIKPQFFLLAIPVLWYLLADSKSSQNRQRLRLGLLVGILLPLVAAFLYMIITKSLGAFLDIAFNYWPLYTHMTRWHEPIGGWDRLVYIVLSTLYGVTSFYLAAGILGLMVIGRDESHRRFSLMMGGILVAATIYPALSGQFFGYHWIPFSYVAICATSLAVHNVTEKNWNIKGAAPVVLVLFMLVSLSSISFDRIRNSWQGYGGEEVTRGGVPDLVSQFLRANMKPGDVVQPLDWTGGAVHGMLMAEAMPATRFMYDFHFYHHISSPYIQELRREFINELAASKPRFIIQVLESKPWPRGEDTTRDFPDLTYILQRYYQVVVQGNTFRILQRVDLAPDS